MNFKYTQAASRQLSNFIKSTYSFSNISVSQISHYIVSFKFMSLSCTTLAKLSINYKPGYSRVI